MHYEFQFCNCSCLLYPHHSIGKQVYHRSNSTQRQNIETANNNSGTELLIQNHFTFIIGLTSVVNSTESIKLRFCLTNHVNCIGFGPPLSRRGGLGSWASCKLPERGARRFLHRKGVNRNFRVTKQNLIFHYNFKYSIRKHKILKHCNIIFYII